MASQIHIHADGQAAAQACGQLITANLLTRLGEAEEASLAISGGSSPKPLFTFLADAPIPWQRVHIFWVDERCVPPDHADSNYRLANELLLVPAKIPHRCIHRIIGEIDPETAARQYAEQLREYFRVTPGSVPEFDVIHQGMGGDAHTASLFPGQHLIEDREGLTASVYAEKLKSHRVTLLPSPLLAARTTVFLTDGEEKADALHQVIEGDWNPVQYPSQLFARDGKNVHWFIDTKAAAKLQPQKA